MVLMCQLPLSMHPWHVHSTLQCLPVRNSFTQLHATDWLVLVVADFTEVLLQHAMLYSLSDPCIPGPRTFQATVVTPAFQLFCPSC